MAGAAKLGRAILSAMAAGASELEQRMNGRRSDERVEPGMRAPWIERVERRILNPLQLRNLLFGLFSFFLRDLERVELLLQLLRESRRFFLRFETRAIDRAMTRHAAIDAR